MCGREVGRQGGRGREAGRRGECCQCGWDVTPRGTGRVSLDEDVREES